MTMDKYCSCAMCLAPDREQYINEHLLDVNKVGIVFQTSNALVVACTWADLDYACDHIEYSNDPLYLHLIRNYQDIRNVAKRRYAQISH